MRHIIKYFVITVMSFQLISCSSKKEEKAAPKLKEYTNLNEGDSIEITGFLICAHCYALNTDNVGIDHQLPKTGFVHNCAIICATENYPIAVLLDKPIDSTKVWIIRTAGETFKDYMTNTAVIKGEYVYRGLIEPANIKVKKGNDWVELK